MASDGPQPRSSWQTWVRASPDLGSSRDERPDDDLDVRLEWGDGREEQPAPRPTTPVMEEPVAAVEEEAELVPAVPLLPSIAGRVDALSGLLRSITMRIDSLSAAHDVYRAAVTDRIDQYTDMIRHEARRTEQLIEEYQRSTDRSASEARRLAADQEGSVAAIAERQAGVERAVDQVRTLVEAVVDTMPGSEEGSAVDLAERIDALQADVLELHRRITAKGDRALATVADLDRSAATIAEAVVARIDVDAIVSAVVARLEEAFEIVDGEPAPEPAPPAKRPGRRR